MRSQRQEGGRIKEEGRTPMDAAHSVLDGRNQHKGKLRVQCHEFTDGFKIFFQRTKKEEEKRGQERKKRRKEEERGEADAAAGL